MRSFERKYNELRPISFEIGVISNAEGSVRVKQGGTEVICTASVDSYLPRWLKDSNQGWVSAEYNLLPRSTHTRISRQKALSSGRSQEISRLIGRSLRACLDLKELGPRQILIDCDVIQADGGTRAASINGSFIALALALKGLKAQKELKKMPLKSYICALSLGIVEGEKLVDLDYKEDLNADVDLNLVFNEKQELVEIQGTGEKTFFSTSELEGLIKLALPASQTILEKQASFIEDFFPLNLK